MPHWTPCTVIEGVWYAHKTSKPPPQKLIMPMLSATTTPVNLIYQLESTLEKNLGMFDKLLQAIEDSKTAMEAQLMVIQIKTGLLRADHAKLAEHYMELNTS
ncbi:hypothetical protein NDU88_001594 [Pleurodeles waltl]|uniref:Uncharacterized protein n=1 Tax=Pleurodeles waltl TaxID=8319 RepID=A0AAV7TKJ1_PLEWA|nr:hypothetical protein NDU88_001594 [Pleurodeles waltl]